MKPPRQKFATASIELFNERQRSIAQAKLANCPIDEERPLEFVLREKPKVRKPDQNALMWAGPLKDIADQAWHLGRQYSDVVWHETYKRLYLPEEFDPELCKEGYHKYDIDRDGEQVLIGSTTQLTVKGFAQYLEQVMADGAGMGVLYHANPREFA